MSGLTDARAAAILTAEFVDTDYLAWSANGTSATASLARTAISGLGNWAAATSANPSVRANASAGSTAAASAGVTVSHFAVYSASTAGTQRTRWIALTNPVVLLTGDQMSIAAGAMGVRATN